LGGLSAGFGETLQIRRFPAAVALLYTEPLIGFAGYAFQTMCVAGLSSSLDHVAASSICSDGFSVLVPPLFCAMATALRTCRLLSPVRFGVGLGLRTWSSPRQRLPAREAATNAMLGDFVTKRLPDSRFHLEGHRRSSSDRGRRLYSHWTGAAVHELRRRPRAEAATRAFTTNTAPSTASPWPPRSGRSSWGCDSGSRDGSMLVPDLSNKGVPGE
jgi:hypothetical protein